MQKAIVDGTFDSEFYGILLGPEVGTIDGNPHGYTNGTNLGPLLGTSEKILDGPNNSVPN